MADPKRRGPVIGDQDLHLWNEGTHRRAYQALGSHLTVIDGKPGVHFAVWAPDAEQVGVIGEFQGWTAPGHLLQPAGHSGIWTGFVPGLQQGTLYKYRIKSRHNGYVVEKADPFARRHEVPPRTGSVVWDTSDYQWKDAGWMKERHARNALSSPMSIYELHLGSWRRIPEQGDRFLTYREMAEPLADYVASMGFTHVELMPVMEHPFYGSWGYQTTGYFAPSSRFGSPQDFMHLVDVLHQRGIGVILDWVPAHFPTDQHGLGYFDGTHLYEHSDRRLGHHPDWDTFVFNYGRHEVRSFLLSSAFFWLDVFHADGLRIDAVASMLYLDYSRKAGEWIPNVHGGRENLDAISFLRRMNEDIYREYPDTQTFAEESTAWPMVSRPLYVGGLGFGFKWDMGWMHDTLEYFKRDPIHRRFHQNDLTFRSIYAASENFVMPLSHDEVVHGKGSLLDKMAGHDRQKFANLRLLYAYMYAQTGKKMLFMGGEFGQGQEWSHERSLDWHLLQEPRHAGVQSWVKDLNHLMKSEGALHAKDCEPGGIEWVDCNDHENSVIALLRWGREGDKPILVVLNFTPVARTGYRVGVPFAGRWTEVLNSDAQIYGGDGWGNLGGLEAEGVPHHGRPASLSLTLPPLGALFMRPE